MDLFSNNVSIENMEVAIRLFQESRKGFLKLFNTSPVCMSMTTTELGRRVYVRVNQAFLDKFGFDESEIIGRTSVEIGILDQEESIRVGNIIKEKGRLQNDYVKCLTKSGDIVHTVSSIENMDINNETYLVSFFVDVTRVMEQQVIIERHAQQLEAVNKELEAFSYSVSHDLRSPLRSISGYARMLEEDYSSHLDDEGKRILLTVQRNVTKMGNLIDDLLAFAKLGQREIQKSNIDMNSLVAEVVDELTKAANHKAKITVAKLQTAKGDYSLIKQVLTNLISNAIKYSSKKESPLVEISSVIHDDQTVFTVKDNGDGFNMAYANKLFGVFQRLHTPAQFEGTGVGLAIVQRIVNKHGGTVSAEGEVGKGAVFSFALPNEILMK